MSDKTNEFSFVLKPSSHGIGVFATHAIKAGSALRLFGDERSEGVRFLDKNDVPEEFWGHCIDRGEKLACARDFGAMPVGWYLNHSSSPNAGHKDYNYFALRDIKAGEEILIDYNSLEEPENAREDYYRT